MIKRRTTPELARLRQDIAKLDNDSVDQLYGLEPVWEPAGGTRVAPEEFVALPCPYCGERLETRVDLTTDEPSYMEDCQVCCRPIEFQIERDSGGALVALRAQRID
jgi:Cysteine-rich CPXCG